MINNIFESVKFSGSLFFAIIAIVFFMVILDQEESTIIKKVDRIINLLKKE